jgi:hypothetical protein
MLRFLHSAGLPVLCCLALGLEAGAADALAPTSPFLPPSAVGAAAAENTPLELRGILVDEGGYRFSVFDPVRHTGTWARLNEPGHDFVIKAYDTARDLITLDYQGRILTVALRAAKVTAVAPAAPAPGPGMSAGAVLNPTPADEVARFNRVKEEIARRRALREQQAGSAASPVRK